MVMEEQCGSGETNVVVLEECCGPGEMLELFIVVV